MLEEGNCAPDFFIRDIFARGISKLPCPGKHSGIPHASLHDPKELVIWFARRVQCKLRSVGIEGHTSFIFAGGIRGAVAAAKSFLKSFSPAIKFSSEGAMGSERCGACRAADASKAMCAKEVSKLDGDVFALIGSKPRRATVATGKGKRQQPEPESKEKFFHGTALICSGTQSADGRSCRL